MENIKKIIREEINDFINEVKYAEGYLHGHRIYLNNPPDDWRYADNDEKVKDNPNRPCTKCGKLSTAKGHDACIADLPNVKFACCGHGKGCGYIAFDDGYKIYQSEQPQLFAKTIEDLKAERDNQKSNVAEETNTLAAEKNQEDDYWNYYDNLSNFGKWFEGSVVVDSNGNPLQVYHGTKSDFSEFENRTGYIYFSETPEYASAFATDFNMHRGNVPDNPQSSVMPVYLRIEKPLDLTHFGTQRVSDEDFIEFLSKKGINTNKINREGNNLWGRYSFIGEWFLENPFLAELVQEAGYDGIIQYEHAFTGGKQLHDKAYIVFKPNQVKSATGNSGEYSLTNPDITKESTEQIQAGEKSHCYKNVQDFMLNNELPNAVAVHGEVTSKGKTIKHAWIEDGDIVYDPTTGIKTLKDKYYQILNPKVDNKYNFSELMKLTFRTQNFGPWTDAERNNIIGVIREEISEFNKTVFKEVPDEIFDKQKLRKFSDNDNRKHMAVFTAKDGKDYLIKKDINRDIFRAFDLNTMVNVGIAAFDVDVRGNYFSGYEVSQSIKVYPPYTRLGIATAITDFAEKFYNMPYKPTKVLSADMQGFVKNRFGGVDENIEDLNIDVQKIADNLQKEPRPSSNRYILANVNVKLADDAFKRDIGYYIDKNSKGILNRRLKIRELIKTGELKYAPIVNILMGRDGLPILSFTDGRHRFAELRDAGAETINLAINQEAEKYIPLLQGNNSMGIN